MTIEAPHQDPVRLELREQPPFVAVRNGLLAVIGILALLAAAITGHAVAPTAAPAETSADAGFARDMTAHHAQAVQMAEIIRTRTGSAAIRTIATDVSLTQTAQMGIMQGWLSAWGLPYGSTAPRMAWMSDDQDHMAGMTTHAPALVPGSAAMPGMAEPADIRRLQTLPVTDADRLFLQLMIAHHRGGIEMAEAGEELASRSEVQQLASRIVSSQRAEINQMQTLLDAPTQS